MAQGDRVTRRGVLGMSIAAGSGMAAAAESKLTALAAPVSPARKRRKKPLLFAKAMVTQIQLDASRKLFVSVNVVWVTSDQSSGGGDFALAGLDPTSSATALHATIVDQVRALLGTSGIAPDEIDVVLFGGPS